MVAAIITATLGGLSGLLMAYVALRRVLLAGSKPRQLLMRLRDWLVYDTDDTGRALIEHLPPPLKAELDKEIGVNDDDPTTSSSAPA